MLVNSGRTRPAAADPCMRRSIVLWLMRCVHHQSARIRCAWRHQRLAAAPRDTRPLQLIERSAYSCLASQRPGIYQRPSALTSARARAPLARQRCTKSARLASLPAQARAGSGAAALCRAYAPVAAMRSWGGHCAARGECAGLHAPPPLPPPPCGFGRSPSPSPDPSPSAASQSSSSAGAPRPTPASRPPPRRGVLGPKPAPASCPARAAPPAPSRGGGATVALTKRPPASRWNWPRSGFRAASFSSIACAAGRVRPVAPAAPHVEHVHSETRSSARRF